jgi:hypothetical protein
MSKRMEIEDLSDDEGAQASSRVPGGSGGDIPSETAQEQAIDENQMINEEYKIWSAYSSFSIRVFLSSFRYEPYYIMQNALVLAVSWRLFGGWMLKVIRQC